MKGYGQLTIAQLRIFGRNRQVLFWTLFFPIFLMIMIGSFIGGGNNVSLQGVIIDMDQSNESQIFVDGLISNQTSMDAPVSVQFELIEDEVKAKELLKQGDIQLIAIVPEGYSEEVNAEGGASNIILYYDETDQLRSTIGIGLVEGVVDNISKEMAGYKPIITVQQEGLQSINLTYIDFLVPGIVAMMIMSNNLNGVAGQISSWRERGVLRRMQSTTLKASTFIAAQITARLLLNGLQALIVLLVGSLVFGTQVNGSWFLLILFVILGTLTFMSIGFIIASIAKTPESAGPIAGFISFPLLFLGGVFFPIDDMPSYLQPIVNSLPIAHLSTAFRQIMNVGADLTTLWSEALLLSGWMIVAFVIASFTFKWD
ncbi:ABC transporter permease [Chengkuizengella axinellae]|uniref:ABC transporter permease n=1 Tax=Chengkuizengella axinellae TaxID=3064388 RepID=A0ABT9J1M4_9BACL|nr:ABC transporter permease [Chengkuizengella sp. 2205SS18-9]MDP5275515.1 ABC transporter permease [Chengkuizengella sp. 2205SS18-9]